MPEHFIKFIDNRKAIEDRVLGAVTRYFLMMDSQSDCVTAHGLSKIHSKKSKTENIFDYYQTTMRHVGMYFSTQSSAGSWSDFQCTLVISIFNDYVKK